MATKIGQIKDSPSSSTKSLDPGNQSESTLRQSKRLRGIPAYAESSKNGSPLMGVTDSDDTLGDHRIADAQSLPPNSNILPEVVLDKPDLDASSEHDETDHENSDDDDSDHEEKNDGVDRSFKSSTSTKSKKRKAAISSKKKTADSTLALPSKKKPKIENPTPKVQRKARKSRPKTTKERHLAASAEDTRPLPWGEPDVWAEV